MEKTQKISINNILNVIQNYRMPIFSFFCLLVMLFSRLWSPLLWGLIPASLIFAFFATPNDAFCYMAFMYCFNGICSMKINGYTLGFVPIIVGIQLGMLLVKYIIAVIKKQKKIIITPFVISWVILFYGFLFFNAARWHAIFTLGMLLLTFYIAFVHARDVNWAHVIRYSSLGIITSSVLGLILYAFPSQYDLVWYLNRWQALASHPNSLQLQCVITIALMMVIHHKKQVGNVEFLISVAGCGVIGLFTQSKAFYLCFMLLIFLYICAVIRKLKKKAIIPMAIFVVVIAIITLVFKDKVVGIFKRFTIDWYNGDFWNNITTGRVAIWKDYINHWLRTPITIIFGYGWTGNELFKHSAHNDFCSLLYHFGLVGFALCVLLVVSYIYLVPNKKQRMHVINFLPIIIVLLLSLEEALLQKREFLFIVFAAAVLFDQEPAVKPESATTEIVANNDVATDKLNEDPVVEEKQLTNNSD